MSLFYKQKKPQAQPPQNQSVVRPYADTTPSSFYSQNKKAAPQPHQQQQQKQKQKHATTFPSTGQVAQKKEEQGLKRSILLANSEQQKESWLTKCCSCANLQGYKKFFKVTNNDVIKRIMMNLQFWTTGFFNHTDADTHEEFDFYGPFWIYTTVVFCLCAVPNILLYQGVDAFQYNFQIVGLAFGFVYLQGFLFPVLLTFLLKMLGVQCTYIQNVCIYGYSMCTCIICLLLCSFNSCILHIVLLSYAFGTKAWFILNNMLRSYPIPIPKKALITGLVVGQAALQFFVVKIFFINCVNDTPAAATNSSTNHLMNQYFHTRSFTI